MTAALYKAAKAVIEVADNKAAKPAEFAEAFSRLRKVMQETIVATPAQTLAASELHASAEVEVDAHAIIAEAPGGYWVSAWVFVPAQIE